MINHIFLSFPHQKEDGKGFHSSHTCKWYLFTSCILEVYIYIYNDPYDINIFHIPDLITFTHCSLRLHHFYFIFFLNFKKVVDPPKDSQKERGIDGTRQTTPARSTWTSGTNLQTNIHSRDEQIITRHQLSRKLTVRRPKSSISVVR